MFSLLPSIYVFLRLSLILEVPHALGNLVFFVGEGVVRFGCFAGVALEHGRARKEKRKGKGRGVV